MSNGEDLSSRAKEFMRKALTVGIGTVFMTEESLRALVGELKLPKEMITGLLESANKARKDFLQDFSRDLLNRLGDKADPAAILSEFVARNDIELDIKVRFTPKKD